MNEGKQYPYANPNKDITLTCDSCGKKELMRNRGTSESGYYQFPVHWVTIREVLSAHPKGLGAVESCYCSRNCAKNALNLVAEKAA